MRRVQMMPVLVALLVCLLGLGLVSAESADAPAGQTDAWFDNRTEPAYLMASLVSAINNRDYLRAWNYWETTPPGVANFDQFARGYADTQYVDAYIQLPIRQDAGAGNVYAAVPTLFMVQHTDGRRQTFVGCYTLHKTNVPVGDNPLPDPNWSIREGRMRVSSPDAFLSGAAICDYTPTFAPGYTIDNTSTPVDLLDSYYNAILQRDYLRAWNYWLNPPRLGQVINDFALGYATTHNISVILNLNMQQQSGGGVMKAGLPVALRSTMLNGTVQYYGGCYQTQYQPGAAPWAFTSASIRSVSTAQGSLDVARCG